MSKSCSLVPCLLVRLTCLNKNNNLRPRLSILSSVSSPLLHVIVHIGMLTMSFISSACLVFMEKKMLVMQGYTLENTVAGQLFVLLILVHLRGDILIFYFLWNQQHNITVQSLRDFFYLFVIIHILKESLIFYDVYTPQLITLHFRCICKTNQKWVIIILTLN